MKLNEASPGAFTPESESALERLKRALRRGLGFSLYVVVAQDAARWEFLKRLHAWSGVGGVPELYFFPEGREVVEALEAFIGNYDAQHPLSGAVIGDSRSLFEEREGEAMANLNLARDNLGILIHGPLIFVTSREHGAKFPGMAPDLFDVRAMSLELEVEALPPAPKEMLSRSYEPGKAVRPVLELRKEAAQLRALGAQGEEAPPAGTLSDAWWKLGRWFLDAGEMGEALDAAREAKTWAEQIGYERGVALACGLTGDVHAWYGRLEEAVGAYGQAIISWERCDDIHSRAIALGKIANILQMKGFREEALRIMQREVLPTLEQLGSERDRAIAIGKIADILDQTGRFDEALRIRQARELPVYQKIGDERERAVTLGKIVDTLIRRGQLDDAVNLLRLEVLPTLERLGHLNVLLVGRANLAIALAQRGHPADQPEIARLLALALADAERLGLPEAQKIQKLQAQLLAPKP